MKKLIFATSLGLVVSMQSQQLPQPAGGTTPQPNGGTPQNQGGPAATPANSQPPPTSPGATPFNTNNFVNLTGRPLNGGWLVPVNNGYGRGVPGTTFASLNGSGIVSIVNRNGSQLLGIQVNTNRSSGTRAVNNYWNNRVPGTATPNYYSSLDNWGQRNRFMLRLNLRLGLQQHWSQPSN